MEQVGGVSRVVIEAEESGPDAPGVAKKGEIPAGSELAGEQKPQGEAAPVKPEWCPEKFWKDGKVDQEGLAKSYGELEKSKSKPTEPAKSADPNTKPDAALKTENNVPVPQPSNIPGINAEQSARFAKELQEGEQKLSDQSYADLEKAGYSRATVDAYINGIKAQQVAGEALVTEMKSRVGGDDSYKAMATWMNATLSAEEIAAYDQAVTSGNRATIELAIDGMNAKYTKAVGSAPKLLEGRQEGQNVGDVYDSMAQVSRDMKNPLYKTDEAFRAKVAAKIARSNIL